MARQASLFTLALAASCLPIVSASACIEPSGLLFPGQLETVLQTLTEAGVLPDASSQAHARLALELIRVTPPNAPPPIAPHPAPPSMPSPQSLSPPPSLPCPSPKPL
eukprot:315909-Prymnesium_polylepis.1